MSEGISPPLSVSGGPGPTRTHRGNRDCGQMPADGGHPSLDCRCWHTLGHCLCNSSEDGRICPAPLSKGVWPQILNRGRLVGQPRGRSIDGRHATRVRRTAAGNSVELGVTRLGVGRNPVRSAPLATPALPLATAAPNWLSTPELILPGGDANSRTNNRQMCLHCRETQQKISTMTSIAMKAMRLLQIKCKHNHSSNRCVSARIHETILAIIATTAIGVV